MMWLWKFSGEAKDTGQALEEIQQEDEEAEISEEAKVTEKQNEDSDSEKAEATNDTVSTKESEKETPIELESEKVAGVEEAEKAEETPEISKTEFQETDEEKLERLKEMVDTFPEEPELWWMDKNELTALYDTFTEICDLYESLDEEQQEQVDMSKLEAAGAFFASYVDPVSLTNTGEYLQYSVGIWSRNHLPGTEKALRYTALAG